MEFNDVATEAWLQRDGLARRIKSFLALSCHHSTLKHLKLLVLVPQWLSNLHRSCGWNGAVRANRSIGH